MPILIFQRFTMTNHPFLRLPGQLTGHRIFTVAYSAINTHGSQRLVCFVCAIQRVASLQNNAWMFPLHAASSVPICVN
jgi:hypothetical protein